MPPVQNKQEVSEGNQNKTILILDANAFISHPNLNQLANKYTITTTKSILAELKDEKTKNKIDNLLFPIIREQPNHTDIKDVQLFAKKTGDISTLSNPDIQLISLALTLYRRKGYQAYIKTTLPQIQDHQIVSRSSQEQQENIKEKQNESTVNQHQSQENGNREEYEDNWRVVGRRNKQKLLSDEEQSDDEEGWVTPENYQAKMQQVSSNVQEMKISSCQKEQIGRVPIYVMSSDYAIQNVCIQMGMSLMALDSRCITSVKRFILQCYLCGKRDRTISNQLKSCDNCGYNTLSKISYTLDYKGNMVLHRKKGWKPNQKVVEWKEKQMRQQQKRRKHQHERKKKKPSIFQTY